MSQETNYSDLLVKTGLAATPHRVMVVEILGSSPSPLTPQEIFMALKRAHPMNRVTLYRILDLLVGSGLVERISAGDRTFRYALAVRSPHSEHAHFYCNDCGNLECLSFQALPLDVGALQKRLPALILRVEIRLDGICKNCLKRKGERK